MADIEKVTVEYYRTIAPRDYEKVHGTVTYSAVIDEGDNPTEVADGLLTAARALVDSTVFDAGEKRSAPTGGPKPTGGAAKKQEPSELAKASTATKKSEPAPRAEPAQEPRTMGTVDKEGVTLDWSEVNDPQEPEITDQELMTAASKHANRSTPENVKELMKKYKIGRLGQLDQPQRRQFIAEMEKLPDVE